MKNRKFSLISVTMTIAIFLVSGFSWALEVRENYNGARMLGMGGAGIAVVNDETALLVNPAGLGKLRDIYGTIIDPEVEGGINLNAMYKANAFSDPFDLEQVKDTTDASRESYYHFRAQAFPSFVVKNFGIGIYGKKLMDAQMNATGAEMTTFYQDDLSLLLGVNLRFFDGRIKIGATAKAIARIEINKDIDPTSSLSLDTNASEGVGIGYDVGIILAAPIVWIPTISAVIRDMGGTQFTAGSGVRMKSQTGTPPTAIDQDMDVALAVFPIHGNRTRSSFTLEYQKIREAGLAVDKTRYYHVGYEFNYADLLFVRAGMNQRYWTGGLELASVHTQIQLASYGEDVGTDGSPVEDRRYVFKFAIRF